MNIKIVVAGANGKLGMRIVKAPDRLYRLHKQNSPISAAPDWPICLYASAFTPIGIKIILYRTKK